MSGSLGVLSQLLAMGQGAAGGGLSSLLAQLENAGLSEQVRSWAGHGKNLPVTAEELGTAFTSEQLDAWAKHAGTTPNAVLQTLSEHLPDAVGQTARSPVAAAAPSA